jgi:hypothetical protein
VIVRSTVAVTPRVSAIDNSNGKVPVIAGVPVITPVVALSPRPGGRVPDATDHVTASTPSAVTCTAYFDPTVAGGAAIDTMNSRSDFAGRHHAAEGGSSSLNSTQNDQVPA